jgi:streptogramin lyase
MVRRLVLADGALWLLATHRARLVRIDLRTGARRKIPLEGEASGDMAASGRFLWVTLPGDDKVVRVDMRTGNFATTEVGHGPAGIAISGEDVWVANRESSTLTRIDGRTVRPQEEIEVPLNPYELAVHDGAVWAAPRRRAAYPRHSSRRLTTPVRSAWSARLARFWFCGRSSIPKAANRPRRLLLTASTVTTSSSAICWLVAGVA